MQEGSACVRCPSLHFPARSGSGVFNLNSEALVMDMMLGPGPTVWCLQIQKPLPFVCMLIPTCIISPWKYLEQIVVAQPNPLSRTGLRGLVAQGNYFLMVLLSKTSIPTLVYMLLNIYLEEKVGFYFIVYNVTSLTILDIYWAKVST